LQSLFFRHLAKYYSKYSRNINSEDIIKIDIKFKRMVELGKIRNSKKWNKKLEEKLSWVS